MQQQVIKIPTQLRNNSFRFTKLHGKIPFEKNWQRNNNYKYDDNSFLSHDNNYGVCCGKGNLVVIDIDGNGEDTLAKIFETLPKTYTVKTGKQGYHVYYQTTKVMKTTAFDFNNSHIDIKAEGGQVVGEGSIHPETKRTYDNHIDEEIYVINEKQIQDFFNIEQKNGYTIKNNEINTDSDDTSRSATEYQQVCKYIGQGKNKEEVFSLMQAFSKWSSSTDSYKEYTYNKAHNYINTKKQEPINDENVRYKVLDYLCDTNDKTKHNSLLEAEEILVTFLINKFNIKTLQQDESLEMWGYESGIYINAGQSLIKEKLRDILGRAFKQSLVTKVINKIAAETYITSRDFFNNEYPKLLPLENGILNIETLELSEFTPTKIFFTKLPISYNKEAVCKNIILHLKTVLKNEEDIDLLQEAIGNCLLKKYTYQKAVMMVGNGRNGKGVTLDLIARLLGIENCSGISLEQLEKDSFALCELHGKLANLGGDLSKTALTNTGKFKTATGGDLLTAPRKFLTPVYFINHSKFFFACNELPTIYDNSRGFWDRWLYFDFPYTFVTSEEYNKKTPEERRNLKIANPKIKDEIFKDEELQGFLNFALAGLHRLMDNNKFTQSKTFEDVKKQWIRQSDSFKAFCEEHVLNEYSSRISKKELRQKYYEFCKDKKLRASIDAHIKNVLTTEYGAGERYVPTEDGIRENHWEGIKLK